LSSQIAVGEDEGLRHHSWIVCDNLSSLRKAELTQFVGSLTSSKLRDLDEALKVALALE
jgi:mRNA interferase MazF